jgi:glutamate carboxypeptidase
MPLSQFLPPMLAHLESWVGINSWTLNPAGVNEVARLTAEAFAPLGFTAESVPSANPQFGQHLWLTRPGSGPHTVLFVSHLDTVFSPEEEARNQFAWLPEGDRIYGPGTHDIKGGTALAWLTLQGLREQSPELFAHTTWQFALNSSEELLSPDFGTLCRQRLRPGTRAALVFEAEGRRDGVRRLVVARKGRGCWRVQVSGRGAHAGVKHPHGANAIVQLGRVVDRIAGLTDYRQDLTVNVGRIAGGSGLNRVPETAEAEGEFRAFTPEAYAQGRAGLLALGGTGDVASPVDGFPCQVRVQIESESPPWARNAGTDGLFGVFAAAAKDLGQRLEPESRGGLSDGNYLWDALPTLDGLGPAGDFDHCSERSADGTKIPEYVDRTSFLPKAELNIRALERLLAD